MMRRIGLAAILLLLVACASKRIANPAVKRLLVFPFGSYTHEVTVRLPSGKEFHFQGIVRLETETVKVVGLGFLSSTMFRITGDRAGDRAEIEIFDEGLKKHEARFRAFFGILRAMLVLPAGDSQGRNFVVDRARPDGLPLAGHTVGLGKEVAVTFETYDDRNIPQTIRIEQPEFALRIEVTAYDL